MPPIPTNDEATQPLPAGMRALLLQSMSDDYAALPDLPDRGDGVMTTLSKYAVCSILTHLEIALAEIRRAVTLVTENTDGNRPALRSTDGRITAAQADELYGLMKLTGTQEGRFLAAMCPELRSLTQAPAADFGRLRNALLKEDA